MARPAFDVAAHGAGVVLVTINRPDKLNAMDPAFFAELPVVLADLDADQSVRAAVLTGAGRAFSAGGDIASFGRLVDVAGYRAHLRLVFDAFHAVERSRVPVIGAVNGIAYGGGCELTLACDMVLASEQARFAFREPTVGLTPGWGVIRGPEVIGRHWTRWLALSGEVIDAHQALAIGLVQRVVPPDQLLPAALELAGRIAANPPLAVAVGKQLVNRTTTIGFAESVEATALLFTTADHKRAVEAFLSKSPVPAFDGR